VKEALYKLTFDRGLITDSAGIRGQFSKCPYVQRSMSSESGREEAMDLAFTAQAVLQGINSRQPAICLR